YYETPNPPTYHLLPNSIFTLTFHFDYGEKSEYNVSVLLNSTLMHSERFYCEGYNSSLFSIEIIAPNIIGNYIGIIHVENGIEALFLNFYVFIQTETAEGCTN
ncbi:MAG: hypothetical protein ACFFBD_30245, partial [Candidatus Hodarchaeota archaeon]